MGSRTLLPVYTPAKQRSLCFSHTASSMNMSHCPVTSHCPKTTKPSLALRRTTTSANYHLAKHDTANTCLPATRNLTRQTGATACTHTHTHIHRGHKSTSSNKDSIGSLFSPLRFQTARPACRLPGHTIRTDDARPMGVRTRAWKNVKSRPPHLYTIVSPLDQWTGLCSSEAERGEVCSVALLIGFTGQHLGTLLGLAWLCLPSWGMEAKPPGPKATSPVRIGKSARSFPDPPPRETPAKQGPFQPIQSSRDSRGTTTGGFDCADMQRHLTPTCLITSGICKHA